MKTPLQQALAAALLAGATLAVAQAPAPASSTPAAATDVPATAGSPPATAAQASAPAIPNATAPTSQTDPQAASENQRVFASEPVASLAGGIAGDRGTAIVEALNADASLKGSKLTVVPGEKNILVTGVTPSLRQTAQVVNTVTQHAGDIPVASSISTEEVFLDGGRTAPDESALMTPEQLSEGAPSAQQEPAGQPAAQTEPQAVPRS